MNELTNMPSGVPAFDREALPLTAQKLEEMAPRCREVRVNRWTFEQLRAVCDAGPGGPATGLRGWAGLPVFIDDTLANNRVEFRSGDSRKVVETKFEESPIAWCRSCETNVVLDGDFCPMCGRRLRASKDEAGV